MVEKSDNMSVRYFYVQLIDDDSGYAVEEYDCGLHDVKEVCNYIGCDSSLFLRNKRTGLTEDQVRKANELFDLAIIPEYEFVDLCTWSGDDGLPYRAHSNRELPLMLAKQKPLSFFTELCPKPNNSLDTPEKIFDPYVKKGLFVKLEYCEPIPEMHPVYFGERVIMYAQLGEEWRINAYILVRSLARKMGWSDALIRLEGSLLGYAEWQNDAFMARSKSSG